MSENISLVDLTISHAKGYTEILSDENTYRFLTDSGPKREALVLQKIRDTQKTKTQAKSRYWAIEGDNEIFMGFIALHDLDKESVFVSYGVHPDSRRRGIATAALKKVLIWKGVQNKTVNFATHLDNHASFFMLKKMNLDYKGIVKTKFGERHVFQYENKTT